MVQIRKVLGSLGLAMKAGDVVIVYPEDVHMPQRRALVPSDVVKACVKIVL